MVRGPPCGGPVSGVVLPLRRGFVSLVGAGPGHPDHLTLRGLRALQAAEVILYDALLDPAYLDIFPAGARALHVGKRCGDHAMTQEAINAALVAEARRGARVVRLKGGDPFLFGRGGEEALALREAGIPFEVIPGLSALNGAAAGAGIPLTHRGLARELRVIEGHGPRSEEEWAELASFRGTLALFMASRSLPAIAASLLGAGADPRWPVALVENACTGRQRVSRACLGEAALGALPPLTEGPGLGLMGPTVPLHDTLSLQGPSHAPAPSPLPRPQGSARPARGGRPRRAG